MDHRDKYTFSGRQADILFYKTETVQIAIRQRNLLYEHGNCESGGAQRLTLGLYQWLQPAACSWAIGIVKNVSIVQYHYSYFNHRSQQRRGTDEFRLTTTTPPTRIPFINFI